MAGRYNPLPKNDINGREPRAESRPSPKVREETLSSYLQAHTRREHSQMARMASSSSSSSSATDGESAYTQAFSTIEEAVEDIRCGRFVVVLDDYDRENEGDLIMASEKATAESLAFMIKHSSGFVCVSARGERLDKLLLPPMRAKNEDAKQTAYAVSVDLHTKHGTTTGIAGAFWGEEFAEARVVVTRALLL